MPGATFAEGTGGNGEEEQQQGQRHGGHPSPQPTPSPDTNYSNIATVDHAARGTLPTNVVLHLAGLSTDDKDLARLGTVFARKFGIPPLYVWGVKDPAKYISPVTGERLTLREARLFSNNFGVVPLTAMLKDQLTYTEGTGYKTARGQQPVNKVTLDPKTVGDFARVIATHIPNTDLQEGIGMSVQLTRMGLDPKKFANNMEWVQRWADTGAGQSPRQLANMAIQITRDGKRLRSIGDVEDIVAPGAREASERLEASYQAAVQAAKDEAIAAGADVSEAVIPSREEFEAKAREQSVRKGQWLDANGNPISDAAAANDPNAKFIPDVEGGYAFPTLGKNIGGTDYWSQVNEEAKRISLDQYAFENSFFGKRIVGGAKVTLGALNAGYQNFWAGAVLIARVPLAGVTAAGSAIYDPQGDSPLANWQQVMAAGRYQAQRLRRQEETPGSLIAEPMGDKYKHWVGAGLDLVIGWQLDPLALAGTARKAYLAEKLLPGILDARIATGTSRDVEQFLSTVNSFASSKVSRRLFLAKDTYTFNRQIYRLRGVVEARGTLDLPFMTALRSKILEAYPKLGDEAWQAWQDGIKAHFLGSAPPGSIAEDVIDARLHGGFRAQQVVDEATPTRVELVQGKGYVDQEGLWVPETTHQAMMNDAVGLVDDVRNKKAFPGWLSLEVPGETRLAEFGPRRAMRAAVTSEKVTETAIGKRLARLPSLNPGRVLEFHNAPTDYVYEHATRWGAFTEAENRVFESRMAEILNSGRGIENRTEALINEVNREGLSRVLSKYPTLDEATRQRLAEDLLEPTNKLNAQWRQQAFGVVEGEKVASPLVESQLRNSMFVVDPMVVRQGVRRYISMRDRVWQSLATAVGKDAPGIGGKLANVGHAQAVKAIDAGGDVYRAWLRFWKSVTVARPAYIPRVILGDENARFLATSSSAGDRLLSVAFGHRAAEDSNFAKRWLDDAFGAELKVGDDIVDLPRAGAYEYEAAAAGQVRQADIINEMVRGRDLLRKGLTADGSYDILAPTVANQEEHLRALSWDLVKQIDNSEPGHIALESVASGKSVGDTTKTLLAWARKDNYTTLRTRIGVDVDQADDWADRLSKVVHSYTIDDAKLAKIAMEGDRSKVENYIRNAVQDPTKRPIVHAPTVAEATDGGAAQRLMSRFTNTLYSGFVRRPEDALNRQPFFALWKRRAEASMYKTLDAVGIDPSVDGTPLFHLPGREGYVKPVLDRPAEDLVPRILSGDKDGYVYHISPPENFDGIKASGLRPNVTTYGDVPVSLKAPRLFFADTLDDAKRLSHSAGDRIALRVKTADVGVATPEELFPGSSYITKGIPKNQVEILGADGAWHRLEDAGHFVLGDIRQAIDKASTDFALGQVRRVMFDFTKQSRFTELLQVAFPFPQPFFEGFQAWGHIAYRNPTAIAHARLLFQYGVESGLFKKDPLTGEYVVPAPGPYRWALMATATMAGGDKKLMDKLATPYLPLANLNMLTSSTLTFGSQGPVGKVIGGVPIPVPGLNPLAAAALMKGFANSRSPVMQGYLYQYGPTPQFLPSVLKAATGTLFPGWFKDDSSKKSLALGITEALHRYGLDRDENGNPIPLNDEERVKMGLPADTKTLEDIANENADALWQSRMWVGLFSPTALRTSFQGQREDYDAFQTYLDNNGGDYSKATSQWLKDHPDKFMIPAGKTWAGPGYEDTPGVRLPASELTYQMFRIPGVGEFMHNNPQWAALLLIGTDPKVQDKQNFAAFADLIAKGFTTYKTPSEYYMSGEDAKVWEQVNTWQKTLYYPAFDKLIDKFGSESAAYQSDAYQNLKQKRQQYFSELYRTDPHWVLQNLEAKTAPDGTVVWDWPGEYGKATPIQLVRRDAHQIISNPDIQDFPGVIALTEYMDGTDKLAEKMNDLRITDINSDKAKEAGLWKKYQKLTSGVLESQPDIAPFLTKYFGVSIGDEGQVQRTDDLVYNMSEREWAFSEVPESLRQNVVALDTKLTELRRKASHEAYDSLERSQLYSRVDNIINRTWEQDPKVMRQWWKAQGSSQQQQYREYLATKPIDFYTAFDYSLVDIKLTKRAAGWLQQMSDARMQIAEYKRQDPTYSSSPGYAAIDAFVKQKLGKDKSFDQAVQASNTWGWGIDHVLGYGATEEHGKLQRSEFDSKGDYLWAKYLKAVRGAQDLIDKYGYSGRNYGTDAERRAYASVQEQAIKLARRYSEDSDQFKQMWEDLTASNGEPIIGSLILPDDYFGQLGGK